MFTISALSVLAPPALILQLAAQQPGKHLFTKIEIFVGFAETIKREIKLKPTSHRIKKILVPNREGLSDWHTVSYPGVVIQYLSSKSDSTDLLSSIHLSSNSIQLPDDLKIGDSADRIVALYGTPKIQTVNKLEYVVGDLEWSSVQFNLKNGKLVSIFWSFEID